MILVKHQTLIEELYKISNPIIQYLIDKEFYQKENITIEQYISIDDPIIKYWLNVYDPRKTHGREDSTFENSIAKLLDLGFTKENLAFDKLYNFLLEDKFWIEKSSFEGILMKTVRYPFLIRAGYWDNYNVNNYFMERIQKIESTIEKYGYNFIGSKKYKGELVFNFNIYNESLPTIYDLYGFAHYPKRDTDITERIEKIVEYILDERYQNLPQKAYIYDESKKRFYAAGNVYHACVIDSRKLLMIYLLSNFKAAYKSDIFIRVYNELILKQNEEGLFEFNKSLIQEVKDSYYIYSGNHMGLGENRKNKNWLKIESTFWMLKILHNIEKINSNDFH